MAYDPQGAAETIGAIIGAFLLLAGKVCIQAYLLTLVLPLFALSITFGQGVLIAFLLTLILG